MKNSWILAAAMSAALTASVHAADARFPTDATLQGKKLVLNGIGVRKATIFKVKVYAGALYLERKSKSAQEILGSDQLKMLRMTFTHDVPQDKLRAAWEEGIAGNCAKALSKEKCDALKPEGQKFVNLMSASEMKDGEKLQLDIAKDEVTVHINGANKGSVKGDGIGAMVLSIWLGEKPPTEDVREGMLGRNG